MTQPTTTAELAAMPPAALDELCTEDGVIPPPWQNPSTPVTYMQGWNDALTYVLKIRSGDRRSAMIVYVAMINDRHTDPTPYVFSTPEAAIRCAKEYAESTAARHGGCEVDEEPINGWLYHATYCTEGDDVWVLERTVDHDDAEGSQ